MALTKIHGWKGEAEILGGLYEVEFERGTLTIKGLDLDGGYAVLEALAAKTIVAARVQAGARPNPVKSQAPDQPDHSDRRGEAPALPKPTAEAKKELPPWDPKVEFPGEPEPVKDRAAPMFIDTPAGRAAVKSINEGMAKEPAKELVMEEEKPAPKPEPVAGVPPEIQNAPNVISVLDWLVKTRGLKPTDIDGVVAAAKEIAPHVGMLRRMGSKLGERVASTLSMFAEGGGA